jgi:hypothetical protein
LGIVEKGHKDKLETEVCANLLNKNYQEGWARNRQLGSLSALRNAENILDQNTFEKLLREFNF